MKFGCVAPSRSRMAVPKSSFPVSERSGTGGVPPIGAIQAGDALTGALRWFRL